MKSKKGEDVYNRLARHLDSLPGGFPSTESGVELRILRRLFTPEEAELALQLTLIPEESRVIARRTKMPPAQAEKRLEELSRKGLIYRVESREGPAKYMAAQFVIGIWEFHVNDLDKELVRDMDEYIPILLSESWDKVPQLRTVPVRQSIPVHLNVLPYENAEEMVRAQKRFLVAPCICRRERKLAGQGCDKLEEACLVFGRGVDYYSRNGLGRVIDRDEALEILRKAEKASLVLQPSNAQQIVSICCCCGCCCGVLRTIKKHPRPSSLVSTPFVNSADSSTCSGCGTCLERCPMGAVRLEGEKVTLDPGRCIGCGLCVSTCPTGSLSLVRKPEAEQPKVPRNMIEMYYRLGQARGKLGAPTLAQQMLRSVKDRSL